MPCRVVVRRARPEDEPARVALLRATTHEYFTPAFLHFFFHEATLQGAVLGGAVLFIFCGASVTVSASAALAAAALVAGAVLAAHERAARRAAAALRAELAGWVCEARAAPPLLAGPPRAVRVLTEAELRRAPPADEEEGEGAALVGTVSLGAWRGPEAHGRLHALGVARGWRRRGLARALCRAARRAAGAAGLAALGAAVSGPQAAARAALQAAGFSLRATYERPLLGAALALPMALLAVDLPSA